MLLSGGIKLCIMRSKSTAGTILGTLRKNELNIREVAKTLDLDYNKLERDGQIKRLFNTGTTNAMPVRIPLALTDGKPNYISTTARLEVGNDSQGNRAVKILFKEQRPVLDKYRNIQLNPTQQKELKKGKTLVVVDESKREYLIKFDKKLNRVGGVKKSAFLVPERLGSLKEGLTKLNRIQQASLKRGEEVQLEMGGKTMIAKFDPLERELNVQRVPKQAVNTKSAGQLRKSSPSL